MVQLLDQYKVAGVSEICRPCEKWASGVKSSIVSEIAPRMRDAIAAKKGAPPESPPVKWWRRIFGGKEGLFA
jgi:hypothetical protein